jgi:hypothetical protein
MSNQSLFSSIYGAKPYEAIAVILYAQLQLVMTNILIGIYTIAKHTKVGMIWVAGRSPTLVSQNLKATTLTYLAILAG